MKSRRLTYRTLLRAGACKEQRTLFRSLADAKGGVDVTVELCVQHADKFDWGWAAMFLLGPRGGLIFDNAEAKAQATYNAARARAQATYNAARAEAWADAYIGDK